jgi:two-component system sensor histidine kinase KdpD
MDNITDKDPDKILQFIRSEEQKTKKGKFRIFFGMAAGVGKTYAMLQSAHRLKSEGVDVVIGYIETHGRKETENLVEGLEYIPRKKIEYKNVFVEEMDLDAIIERNPQVVLVDELAHTNTPGLRHPKRYMDTLEIIDHGISVFSTLNVQHLESQADMAYKITGTIVRETLPDSILDRADDIKLMDLMPEELLKRLEEGKVYTEEKVALALENFFKKENLTALREMALHFTARKVDHELDEYRKYSRHLSQMNEKLMVCVSSAPDCASVIKWTRKIAFNMKIDWIAVYVDTGKKILQKDEEILHGNLELARKLGAETIVTADESVLNGVLRMAHERNITQLVMGRSPEPKNKFWPKGKLMETLLKVSPDLHISVISHEPAAKTKKSSEPVISFTSEFREYMFSAAATISVSIAAFMVKSLVGYRAISFLYLIFVLMQSLYLGRGPVFLSAILSALFFNFLFIEPYFTFQIGKPEDLLMFITYIIAAIITGHFTSKMKNNERILRKREKRLWSLYDLVQKLPGVANLNDIILLAVKHIENFFNVKTSIILSETREGEARLQLSLKPHSSSGYQLPEKEMAVANWVFQNERPAGKFTDTLPLSESLFYPLLAPGGVMGVLAIRMKDRLTLGQDALLKTFASQIALAIERKFLADESHKAAGLQESDKLYKILFNLVSHELRTPLTVLNTACENLQNEKIFKNEEHRNETIREITRASWRLNRLVENLLDMSRLETGTLTLSLRSTDIYELMNSVKKEISMETDGHKIELKMEDNLPPINVDFILMQRSLMNLIVNAIQASPKDKVIRIEAQTDKKSLFLKVCDEGPGISPRDIPFIFEKFHKGEKNNSKGGVGLGLSIVKGVVAAHKGKITVESSQIKPGNGTIFTISLPLLESRGVVPKK